MNNQNNQIQAKGLDFDQASDVICDDCNHTSFVVRFYIKRFSALISPTGEETLVPMQVFACSNCGHVNEEFLP